MELGLVDENADIIGFDGKAVPSGTYSITEKGIRYLEYKSMVKWRRGLEYIAEHWISFLALIIAIIGLFTPQV